MSGRSRSEPWFTDPDLAPIPRRDDLFVDAHFASIALHIAMTGGKTVRLSWMSLQFDEDRDADMPVQREEDGLAVMDITASSPLGYVYAAHPVLGVLLIPLDVITYIAINL